MNTLLKKINGMTYAEREDAFAKAKDACRDFDRRIAEQRAKEEAIRRANTKSA